MANLAMASIDIFENSAQCDKLLESMRALRPLLAVASNNHEVFHGYVNGSPMGASSPTTISTEDLDILDSPTILSSLDQEMLLSSLGSVASSAPMDINCDEWNLSSEGNFTPWKLHEFQDQANLPIQQLLSEPILTDTDANTVAVANPDAGKSRLSWFQENETNKIIKAASLSPSLPLERKSSFFSPKSHGFKRPKSANDLLKQLDSSDNSDAMDDDDGDKLSPNGKTPISKNLVSERRRRKKLNERLYSLRAIVPKISKMDKASIVGDAISYVQDLQKQVEDMQSDIFALQSSTDYSVEGLPDCPSNGMAAMLPSTKLPVHKILELDVSKMEEQTYHLRIHCKKGPGVLVQLTRALEALDFEIVNANLTSVSDHILNTIVMKVKNGEMLEPEELREMVLGVVPKFGLSL